MVAVPWNQVNCLKLRNFVKRTKGRKNHEDLKEKTTKTRKHEKEARKLFGALSWMCSGSPLGAARSSAPFNRHATVGRVTSVTGSVRSHTGEPTGKPDVQ
jgi:hypothetical protein